ncbi:hypothetical protein ACIQVK_10755 [Streptomyces sp. NPDC090493]|uniref:hypothetical protein n=1 Tax=Streptomyces sp. NPDC090493 TaxID=3365964 RepID=UPI0038295EF9
MQVTDEGGGAYGDGSYADESYGGESYGDARYGRAHSHASGGSTATTITKAGVPEPWGTDTPLPRTGPDQFATAEWDSPHGDVITVLPPDQGTPEDDSVRPVFVDASGRRQRRVRRAARLLVIPAVGYVVLLISTVLGGPTISSPFVPLPDPTHPAAPHATAPGSGSGSSSGKGHAAGTAGSGAGHGSSRGTAPGATSGAAGRPTTLASAAATAGPTATPTGTTSPTATTTATPSATPTTAHSAKGRSIASSHKPVK